MDEDGLRKLLQSLELKARETGRALNAARGQVAAKERDRRIAELTLSEIGDLPADSTQLYRGLGKMFVMESPATIKKSLKEEQKEASDALAALQKKQKFLESELQQTNASARSIFQR